MTDLLTPITIANGAADAVAFGTLFIAKITCSRRVADLPYRSEIRID